MKIDDLTVDKMHKAALSVYKNAYAPYSNFSVASAILCDDGQIYTGVNIENASYGITRCAEQIAAGTAITNGCRNIIAAIVITKNGDSWPCGTCRQVLAEFNVDMTVLIADEHEIKNRKTMRELLPFGFSSDNLKKSDN